jgi:hypothetical protein
VLKTESEVDLILLDLWHDSPFLCGEALLSVFELFVASIQDEFDQKRHGSCSDAESGIYRESKLCVRYGGLAITGFTGFTGVGCTSLTMYRGAVFGSNRYGAQI